MSTDPLLGAMVTELQLRADSWQKEAEGNQESLDEASALLESVEQWANGSTTFPGGLLAAIRLFLGPQKCGACRASGKCSVHAEEEPPE